MGCLETGAVGPVEGEPDRWVAAGREPSLVDQGVVTRAQEDAVVDRSRAAAGEVDDVMDVARATPAAREPTSPTIAHHDRPALRGRAPTIVQTCGSKLRRKQQTISLAERSAQTRSSPTMQDTLETTHRTSRPLRANPSRLPHILIQGNLARRLLTAEDSSSE